jgi:DNA-binding GntR family transcriptional regulator
MNTENFITTQEKEILDLIRERKSLTVDELYREIFISRIFGRSWLVRNAIKRLHYFGLIKLENNRISIISGVLQ